MQGANGGAAPGHGASEAVMRARRRAVLMRHGSGKAAAAHSGYAHSVSGCVHSTAGAEGDADSEAGYAHSAPGAASVLSAAPHWAAGSASILSMSSAASDASDCSRAPLKQDGDDAASAAEEARKSAGSGAFSDRRQSQPGSAAASALRSVSQDHQATWGEACCAGESPSKRARLAAAQRTPGPPPGAAAAAMAVAASPGLALVEQAISRAHKVQLDSLRRQLQDLEAAAAEKASLQAQLQAAVAEHARDGATRLAQIRTLTGELQTTREDAERAAARHEDEARQKDGALRALRARNTELEAQLVELAARPDHAKPCSCGATLFNSPASALGREDAQAIQGAENAYLRETTAVLTSQLEASKVQVQVLQDTNDALAASAVEGNVAADAAAMARGLQQARAALQELGLLAEGCPGRSNANVQAESPPGGIGANSPHFARYSVACTEDVPAELC